MYTPGHNEGIRKQIMSHEIPAAAEAGMHLFEDVDELKKQASMFDLSDPALRPDKDHVCIHLVGLGASEYYGANQNYDEFPEKACRDRHFTFVKHGHVFVEHANTDPDKRVGEIVKSAYNDPMHRIELIIHAHREKAQDQLHKLATRGEHGFSMGCKVPFDICTYCQKPRRGRKDPNQCEHMAYKMGTVYSNGRAVHMRNDIPTWFDMSFVGNPAAKIAWDLKVACADGAPLLYTPTNDILVPDSIECDHVPGYSSKLAMLDGAADMEREVAKILTGSRSTMFDRYVYDVAKTAAVRPADSDIDALRGCDPDFVLGKLASMGIVLSPVDFFKFAMGSDYGELKEDMPEILSAIRGNLYGGLRKTGRYQQACRNVYFDVDPDALHPYAMTKAADSGGCFRRVSEALSARSDLLSERVIECTLAGRVPAEMEEETKSGSDMHVGAEIYGAYTLSALKLAAEAGVADRDTLLALTIVRNLTK